MRSRNFTDVEICNGPIKHPLQAAFQMGYMQAQKDRLCKKYKKNIRLQITSGDRTGYNDSVPGSASNSFHNWGERVFAGKAMSVMANDVRSPDLPLEKLYEEFWTTTMGEVYINYPQQIVHIAPCGPDEHFEKH